MLVLTASTYNGAPSERLSAAFDETGGTIGRADHNHMVLPDRDRTVSRVHAQVAFRNGSYVIVDRGSNPIEVNGKELGSGREEPLHAGDTVQIGAYVLAVSSSAASAAADPFADTGASAHRLSPSDSWPATSAPTPLAPAKPLASSTAAIPNDWDPFGEMPSTMAAPRAPSATISDVDTPRAAPLPRPSTPAAAPISSATPDALLASFLDGLNVPDLQLETLTPGLMRQIGQLLRESTRGTVELLAARTALKREVRAEVTMIVARENNPLKFSPSVEVALQHLLGPPARGFLPASAAMRDAFDDLRAHQIGVLAGMRAALEGLLARFDPAQLEATLAPRTGLANLIPASRKSRLWESFEALYSQLSREAEDEFHQLFGEAFVYAYETYIAQLQRDDAPPQ
jgi:FHA domain-containing protein/type VI secretion system protein